MLIFNNGSASTEDQFAGKMQQLGWHEGGERARNEAQVEIPTNGAERITNAEAIQSETSDGSGHISPQIVLLMSGQAPPNLQWTDILADLVKVANVRKHGPKEVSIKVGYTQEFFRRTSDGRVGVDAALRISQLIRSKASFATFDQYDRRATPAPIPHHLAAM